MNLGDSEMSTDATPQKSNKSQDRRLAWFALGCAAVSALAAVFSGYAMYKTVAQNTRSADDNIYFSFQRALSELNEIEQHALGASDTTCGSDDCLASLAFGETYYNQYEVLALQAASLARRVENHLSDIEALQLGKSLYICGRLAQSHVYAERARSSDDPLVRFRATLLLAQIAFWDQDLKEGPRLINQALEELTSAEPALSRPEMSLSQIQAHLTCASMQIALGMRGDGRDCMKAAYALLQKLPRTTRRDQLENTLRNLLTTYIDLEAEGTAAKNFEAFEAEIRGEQPPLPPPSNEDGRSENREPTPAAPPALVAPVELPTT